MWKLVYLSKKWYGVKYDCAEDLLLEMEEAVFDHVNQGTIVALADDLEWFAEEMGLNVSDITVVERE